MGGVTARSEKTGLLAIAGLTAGFAVAGVLSMRSLPPDNRSAGASALAISVLAGAAGTAILALVMRNPNGSIITKNPAVLGQRRLRNRRWASGSLGVLLAIGLILGFTARGMVATVLFGALAGFGAVVLVLALLAYFKVVRPQVSSGSSG